MIFTSFSSENYCLILEEVVISATDTKQSTLLTKGLGADRKITKITNLHSCTPKCLKTPKSIEICLNRPPSIFCGMQVCIVYHSHLLTGIKFRTCRIVPYRFGQWCFVICCFSFLLFFSYSKAVRVREHHQMLYLQSTMSMYAIFVFEMHF